MGNKGEEIRGALDEGGMRATMFTKEERREGEEGSGAGTRHGGQEPTVCWEKEKRTVHKDGECGTMSRPRENRVLKAQHRRRPQGTQRKYPGIRSAVN